MPRVRIDRRAGLRGGPVRAVRARLDVVLVAEGPRGALPPPPRVRVVRPALREPRAHVRVPDRRVSRGGLRERRGGQVRRGDVRGGPRDDRSYAARSPGSGRHRRGRRRVPGAAARRGIRGDGRLRALRSAPGGRPCGSPGVDSPRAVQRGRPRRRVVHAHQLYADDRARPRPARGLPRRGAGARSEGSGADRLPRPARAHRTCPQAALPDLRHRARPALLPAEHSGCCSGAPGSSESRCGRCGTATRFATGSSSRRSPRASGRRFGGCSRQGVSSTGPSGSASGTSSRSATSPRRRRGARDSVTPSSGRRTRPTRSWCGYSARSAGHRPRLESVGEAGSRVDDDRRHTVASERAQQVLPPRRVRRVEVVEQRSRRVAKPRESVDLRRVRAGIDVPPACMGLEQRRRLADSRPGASG